MRILGRDVLGPARHETAGDGRPARGESGAGEAKGEEQQSKGELDQPLRGARGLEVRMHGRDFACRTAN